ncbi:peptidase [Brachybacterium sp. P6-10-X1]|uniref:PepSY-associated TM helix domain-containing protein n=1 Tax=Brachybacterium sp. P6-10-X1 TaxID=1903186 RepID=UPI0009717A4F|nr:PepSY-associated TM helix domain-containing protein [Brachybacterium sp. P6-10-X1]APX33541.1 peptidase [Brachybacterium sp. P6-10-X1]
MTTTRSRQGWFGQLLLRLHFYAAIFIGPFILVSAASGALYAMTPQLEQIVHAEELTAESDGPALPLAEQVEAATAHMGRSAELAAVRPAPEPGETTRVMFAEDSLGESETRAIFVDPVSAEIRGDLTVYGTNGSLPLRTWVDQLHRSLHLGDVGRLYSELSASWLGVIAAAGLGLWIRRARRAHRARDLMRPDFRARGYRRTLSLHTSAGVWVLLGALFLSATGITWSQYGGGNIGTIREAFGFTTATVSTQLPTSSGTTGGDHGGEHAGHGDGGHEGGGAAEHVAHGSGGHDSRKQPGTDPTVIDGVLAAGRAVNIDTGQVEILPPDDVESAWVVQEIQRSYPTEVDAVAVDGATFEVVDRTDFADQDLAAKLTRWGIDLHMGTLFGLANQIVLVVIASALVAMILWGYRMWWQRRPTRGGRRVGRPPQRGALTRAPWWGVALVLVGAVGIALMLPLMGASLTAFVVLDTAHGRLTARRER